MLEIKSEEEALTYMRRYFPKFPSLIPYELGEGEELDISELYMLFHQERNETVIEYAERIREHLGDS